MKKAVHKRGRKSRPALHHSGVRGKLLNAPLDEGSHFGRAMNVPAVNISETEKEFTLTIAAPGLGKSNFKVESFKNLLTVSAEKENQKEEKIGRYNRREYNYSSWSRTFDLPGYVDTSHIEANYEKGELNISLHKTEVTKPKKVRTINVK